MGKRKLHTTTYFQCDWTGLPMRHTNCYMPGWNTTGKLVKHGSYSCWEAVVAHANEEYKEGRIDDQQLKRVTEYINDLVGCVVQPAPHYSRLAWFGRATDEEPTIETPEAFLKACEETQHPVVAVRMQQDGVAHEVVCGKEDIRENFAKHLTRPYALQGPLHTPQSFQTVRKKGSKDRDLTVFYWPFKNGLPFNQTASNMFKMQIYGDVLLVQQTREPCFLPRDRYVNYTLLAFNEQFAHKTRRKDATPTFTTEDYAVTKAQMASELQQVEALAASSAALPGELAKASVLPPASGKELAALLVATGQTPPPKRVKKSAAPLPPAVVPVAA